MTTDQWVALIGQIGVGGMALLGMAWLFAKVVVPMASSKAGELIGALRDLTAEVRQLRADNTDEHRAIIAALSDIGARISRLEGIFDHHDTQRSPTNPGRMPVAEGSRDMTDTARPLRDRR